MSIKLERRPYGPESTPAEIEAIKACVYLYSDGIVMWREAPIVTVFQLDLFAEKLRALTEGMSSFKMLIDLTDVAMPGATERAKLWEIFSSQTKLTRVAAFTGKNFLMNVVATFVLRNISKMPYSLHTTKEEALAALGHGV
jgi:hypothetical protein